MYANSLRAIGDSVTPLLFLILSSVINVVLDYWFILGLGMGVGGAAWAMVISQVVSVVLCFIRVRRKFPILHVAPEDFRLEKEMVSELLKSGLSMALMSCLVSFGTVSLQSAINKMGTAIIVAHTATRKLFEIVMVPSFVIVPVFGYWGIIWSEPVVWILMVIPLIISTIRVFRKNNFS